MIRYSLACKKGHSFESWFQSSDAYDAQEKRGLISCPICGSTKVEKALMAPKLGSSSKKAASREVRGLRLDARRCARG